VAGVGGEAGCRSTQRISAPFSASSGVTVVRDGVVAPRPARRSTFYRNVEGWLLAS